MIRPKPRANGINILASMKRLHGSGMLECCVPNVEGKRKSRRDSVPQVSCLRRFGRHPVKGVSRLIRGGCNMNTFIEPLEAAWIFKRETSDLKLQAPVLLATDYPCTTSRKMCRKSCTCIIAAAHTIPGIEIIANVTPDPTGQKTEIRPQISENIGPRAKNCPQNIRSYIGHVPRSPGHGYPLNLPNDKTLPPL